MGVVRLPVITGPTAAGKTELALALAQIAPVTVISADSRQLYRGFDIGTAKPSAETMRDVPHRGIDLIDARGEGEKRERFSAARWAAAAAGWAREAIAADRRPLIVGGTGFYLRALFAPLFEEPPLDEVQRSELGRRLQQHSTDELREMVQRIDPARADLGRTQLLRAIEIHELTGVTISEWHRQSSGAGEFEPRYLIVDAAAGLRDRIERRFDSMVSSGWVEEVRALSLTVPSEAAAWSATGYRFMRQHIDGEVSNADLRRLVTTSTWQYARRQRTWIRGQIARSPEVDCRAVNSDENDADVRRAVLEWWRELEGV
ncbi:MAG: tRNA (adenosine(37)-N6)-dimethylallyltransferase MiaA [Gemmatimonadota bacterium]